MSVQRLFISSRWQNKFERRIKNVEVAMVCFKQLPEHFHGVTEENIKGRKHLKSRLWVTNLTADLLNTP
jgi:hypothetical protein